LEAKQRTTLTRSFSHCRKHFGFDSFYVMAHDRGARVAHRLALDHPDKVKKMILLDIAPTLWMYEHTSMEFVSENQLPGDPSSVAWHLLKSALGDGILALVLPHPADPWSGERRYPIARRPNRVLTTQRRR
jgi:pimeloyl-ACP methyl ester carboxylesterase